MDGLPYDYIRVVLQTNTRGGNTMSAGALFGTIMNFFLFAGLWVIVGTVFDKIGATFNITMKLMPTMQDAVNGFALTQLIYSVLPVVVFIALVVNYLLVENSTASGEV
jgi:hypothetical protein